MTDTVIAAVSLLHERSVEEIAGKLTPAELADVTSLVSRCPSCYPPGAFDALKALRNVATEQPATRATAGGGANRPLRGHRRASAELGPHTERRGPAERANRAHDADPRKSYGGYLQGSYTFDRFTLGASYGVSYLDTANAFDTANVTALYVAGTECLVHKNESWIGFVRYKLTSWVKLQAEYIHTRDQNTIGQNNNDDAVVAGTTFFW